VCDQQNAAVVPADSQLGEELSGLTDNLPVALAAGKRHVDMRCPFGFEIRDRRAVELTVIALSQPRVLEDRNLAAVERNRGGLDRPGEIGHEDGGKTVVAAPDTEVPRVRDALVRQLTWQPPGGGAGFVVG
jgi:hypothetical protein